MVNQQQGNFRETSGELLGNFWAFSALSVEPYGESAQDVDEAPGSLSFSALSVEPYGESRDHGHQRTAPNLFQCSLCRAVW